MKIKHINFLCGLPRSGSTLLINLLNQHPKIYASPHSGLLEGLLSMRESFVNSDSVKFNLRVGAYQETLWTAPQNFYRDIKKDIIFDKQFCWSTPDNYEIAKRISMYPRFILCYRPILEVLASFVSKSVDNPNFYLNKELELSNHYGKHYLSKNDVMAEYLMNEHNTISHSMLGLYHAKKNEQEGIFKFVAYDDLVTKPQKVMNDIFDFMKVEQMEIQTENLSNIFLYNDVQVLGTENFHHIRPQIKKESPKPEDLFSDYILQKYANALAPIGL
jgi:hypothetical protein